MSKFIKCTTSALLIFFILQSNLHAQHPETALGWQLGAQTWTFKQFNFAEALAKVDSCKLSYIEAFPKQLIGNGIPGTMDYHMDKTTQKQVLSLIKKRQLQLIAYGVVSPNNERDWITLFKFAKAMGIRNITSEPQTKDLALVSKLCDKYRINLAIHNHPKPSFYWSPDTLLRHLSGLSKRIGACADIGHWVRSGLNPVTSLQQLEGRLIQLHFKDLNEIGANAHDVHWGTGISNIQGVITELKRQKFKGLISAEYEYNWDNNAPDVFESVKAFREMVNK